MTKIIILSRDFKEIQTISDNLFLVKNDLLNEVNNFDDIALYESVAYQLEEVKTLQDLTVFNAPDFDFLSAVYLYLPDDKKEFYFYNGFSKPELIAKSYNELITKLYNGDLEISSTYQGFHNSEILEEISNELFTIYEEQNALKEDFEYIEDFLQEYGIFTQVKDMQEFNLSKLLQENDYLEDFIN